MDYQEKYLKYKQKYLKLKKELEYDNVNVNDLIQNGGSLFGIDIGIKFTCADYYNELNYYKFGSYKEMTEFLIKISGYNKENNTWTDINADGLNYKDTVLSEIMNIDFDLDNKFNNLPELVKLLLNVIPKPAHILQMACTKTQCIDIINIINNTYPFPTDWNNGKNYVITKAIHNRLNPKVIKSIQEILLLVPYNPDAANTWDSLTKLLEFIACISDGILFSETLTKFSTAGDDTRQQLVKKFKELIIQLPFLEEIILYNKERRNFRNLYKNNLNQNQTSNTPSYDYSKFILKDFFNKNTEFYLPPSVILLLSIKLNPIINKREYSLNKSLTDLLNSLRFKCEGVSDTKQTEIKNALEQFNDLPKDQEFKPEDSTLIDSAVLPIINGNFGSTGNENISTSKESQEEKSNIDTNLSLIQKIGLSYNTFVNQISSIIPSTQNLSQTSIKNFIDKINIFKQNNNDRIKNLEEEILKLGKKKQKIVDDKPSKNIVKTIQKIFTTKERQLTNVDGLIEQYKQEIDDIKKVKTIKDDKINIILSNILSLLGIGLQELQKDVCVTNNSNSNSNSGPISNINFRSFDKILKMFDSRLFQVLNFAASDELMYGLFQYVTPYTTYLPIDIKKYLYEKLKLTKEKDIEKFNKKYKYYESELFTDYTNPDKSEYYYTDSEIVLDPVEEFNKNKFALFPPSKLLNDIKLELIKQSS